MISAIQSQTRNLPKNWMPRVVQFVPSQSATHILVRGYAETLEGRTGDRTFLYPLVKCQKVVVEDKVVGQNRAFHGTAV